MAPDTARTCDVCHAPATPENLLSRAGVLFVCCACILHALAQDEDAHTASSDPEDLPPRDSLNAD